MAPTNGKVSFARATPKATATATSAPAQATAPKQAQAPAPTATAPGGFVVGGSTFVSKPLEARVYLGILIGIYDIGTQDSTYLGTVSQKRKCVLLWELVGERVSGTDQSTGEAWERPRTISKRYTLSMGDKAALRRDIEAVKGKKMTREEATKFDVSTLLGLNAQLQITQRPEGDKVYNDIQTLMATMKGHVDVEPESPCGWFHFSTVPEGAALDASLFPESMPKWTVEKAMTSPEWVALGGQPPAADPMDQIGG